ncbi:hypothetical protein [uncultured Alsobacter sp.]|uniref:hypothetical protein n=1 Tax=uncultured Alsobacter sp. TaxID=1748258 RepID=UPI0025E39E36|nr:hypothetical protein [uncultured Alsobacter sp.]
MSMSENEVGADQSGAEDRLKQDLDELRADVAKLTETVAQLLRNQAEVGAEKVGAGLGAAREALGETAESFAKAGRGIAEDAQNRLGALGNDLERSIQRSPLTAVVAAAAMGMVLGLINRSR